MLPLFRKTHPYRSQLPLLRYWLYRAVGERDTPRDNMATLTLIEEETTSPVAAYPTAEAPPTVAELVRAAQLGDRQAQGELFERYQQMVLSVAYRRLGDFSDAQELVQEVFVQALQKLGQLRTPECFGSWLRSITVRMAINRMVRGDRAVSTEPTTLEATVVSEENPHTSAVADERAGFVRDGLDRLREMDRDTLVAFYVRGQSLLEMSDHFDAPIGTIKRRLHVARQRLAKEIEHLVSA